MVHKGIMLQILGKYCKRKKNVKEKITQNTDTNPQLFLYYYHDCPDWSLKDFKTR